MAHPLDPEKLQAALAHTMSTRARADEAAAAWIDRYIGERGLDRDKLTKADWFLLVREVPCGMRCWRIGAPVEVEPGECCPECGKLCPLPTVWDRLMEG